jgi:GT2 family glycosyltransferase
MNLKDISIIIPVFNQWAFTEECLTSLYKTLFPQHDLEIIVVNNNSTDETLEQLYLWEKKWPAIKIFSLKDNLGFSPACNYGADMSTASHLLFLNNDIICQEGWLEPLVQELKNPNVGIVGPKLLYPDSNKINHAGYVLSKGVFQAIYHNKDGNFAGVNKKRDYQALLGACILLSKDLFNSLGKFSLGGLEDIDLCLKAKKLGLVSRYVPESVLYHHGSVTLRNSPAGSYPITQPTEFIQRWQNEVLEWDDFKWYLIDQEWPSPALPIEPTGVELASQSVALLVKAYQAFASGQDIEAHSILKQSISLWPQNPMAFISLCKVLVKLDLKEELVHELSRIKEFEFYDKLYIELESILRSVVER